LELYDELFLVELDEELFIDEEEPSPLDLPPMPPALEEVDLRVMVPEEDVDVLGFTTDPGTFLFWKLPLL
jgi:hypothetical protein